MGLKAAAYHAMGRRLHVPDTADIPAGRWVELPGRGTTYAVDIPGPDDAPTLFLFHALGCSAYLNWFPALAALTGRFRIVTMDMRWHGRGIRSGRFNLEDCVDDAAALLDELGIDHVIAVGYSMGGALAQLFWHRHRDRVDGIVLCATARNFAGTPQEKLFFQLLPGVASPLGRLSSRRAAKLTGRILERTNLDRIAGSVAFHEWAWREFRTTSVSTLLQAVAAIGRFNSNPWLGEVTVPAAVCVATQDKFIPPRRQYRLAEAIPGATVHPFAGAHAACVLAVDAFVPALVDAVRSVSQRLDPPYEPAA